MVDEWPFEFLPGNSSLIFRIILASNFGSTHETPPNQRRYFVAATIVKGVRNVLSLDGIIDADGCRCYA